MKTGIAIKWLSLAMMLAFTVSVSANKVEKKKSIHESFNAKPGDVLYLYASEATVAIETWDQNKVDVTVTIKVRADSDEDAQAFLDNANVGIEEKPDGVKINSLICASIQKNNNRMKVKFDDGKWYKLRDFDIGIEVKMPKNNNLDINASYGTVAVTNVGGDVTLDAYDSYVSLGDIGGKASLDSQYGQLKVGNVPNPERVKLYETKFECGNGEDMEINSHYSRVTMGVWDEVKINSYEDVIFGKEIRELTGKATYSKIDFQTITSTDLKLYESDMKVVNAGRIELHSQYGDFCFEDVKDIRATNSYEDKYVLGKVGDMQLKGQYVRAEIEQIDENLESDCYECRFTVTHAASTMRAIKFEGQYSKLEADLDEKMIFDLDLNLQYPTITVPFDDFESRINLNDDDIEAILKSSKSGSQRTQITLHGYDGQYTLRQ